MKFYRTTDQRILDLESEVESLKRQLAVADAETKSMAAVIARDRARIEAETAIFNRKRATAEGLNTDDGVDQSIRRFSA